MEIVVAKPTLHLNIFSPKFMDILIQVVLIVIFKMILRNQGLKVDYDFQYSGMIGICRPDLLVIFGQ